MVKTVVGSFETFDEAERVTRDLIDDGFMQADINVIASNARGQFRNDERANPLGTRTVTGAGFTATIPGGEDANLKGEHSGALTGAVTGGVIGGAAGLAASLMSLTIPVVGPVIAAGPIVAALSGAGAGAVAGGLIGGLTDLGVSKPHAEYYAESVRRGGALVTVRADEARAERAAEIMREHGAIDIDRRVEQWRESGWRGWDGNAEPYTSEELERERRLYGATSDSATGMPMPRSFDYDEDRATPRSRR